jgi:hypothetical protein
MFQIKQDAKWTKQLSGHKTKERICVSSGQETSSLGLNLGPPVVCPHKYYKMQPPLLSFNLLMADQNQRRLGKFPSDSM